MSIFASDTVNVVDVPGEPGQTATLQKLNGRQLGRAATSFTNQLIADLVARGGAKVQKEMAALFADDKSADDKQKTADAIAVVQADPLHGYDKYALMYAGIKSWSYGKSLALEPVVEKTADGRDVTVMRVLAIDDLEDDKADFFAREILRLTKPSLFQSSDERQAAQKND